MFENIADDLSIMLVEKGIIRLENREFFYVPHLAISKLYFFGLFLRFHSLQEHFS